MMGYVQMNSNYCTILLTNLPVESIIVPVAAEMEPIIIPVSDDGMFNIKLNCSADSITLSAITGTLTLLIVAPLANVAVSVAVLKSTPPVSQTFFSQHIIIHTLHYYLEQTLVTVLME